MNRVRIARSLIALAKEIMAGTWRLPENPRDVAQIVKMVKRMQRGQPPLSSRTDPNDAFYGLLGDDRLFDRFDDAKDFAKREGGIGEGLYMECADAVKGRVRELVREGRKSFRNPSEYDMLVELAKRI